MIFYSAMGSRILPSTNLQAWVNHLVLSIDKGCHSNLQVVSGITLHVYVNNNPPKVSPLCLHLVVPSPPTPLSVTLSLQCIAKAVVHVKISSLPLLSFSSPSPKNLIVIFVLRQEHKFFMLYEQPPERHIWLHLMSCNDCLQIRVIILTELLESQQS